MFNTPVLYLIFNRPGAVEKSFESIRKIRPKVLYINSDGARSDRIGEQEIVNNLRIDILQKIDWECDVRTKFNKENLGCKRSIHDALQWFFDDIEAGIVIEDDIVLSLDCFYFMQEALGRLKNEKSIASIGGRKEFPSPGEDELLLSNKFFCWGWATWSDRVKGFRLYSNNQLREILLPNDLGKREKYMQQVVTNLLRANIADSWAYNYDIKFRAEKKYHIIPGRNLVLNVGFDIRGAHSTGRGLEYAEIEYFDYIKALDRYSFNKCLKKGSFWESEYLNNRFPSTLKIYFFARLSFLYPLYKSLKRAINR